MNSAYRSLAEHGWSLWRQLVEGRPAGHPEYRRPQPPPRHMPALAQIDFGALSSPGHLDAHSRLALFASAVAGVARFEQADLVGPHHSAPSIRGVRVTELEALLHGRWTAYDPTRHAFADPQPAGAAACAGVGTDPALPDALRLVVDLSRVPVGYAPVREVVGLMEAGMHLATFGWMAGLLHPAAAFELGEVPHDAARRWTLATVDLRRGRVGSPHPLTSLAAVTHPDHAIRARSAGRGPWGLVPARGTDAQREHVRARIRSLLADDRTSGVTPVVTPVVLPAEVLADAFTYPDDRVDVAEADAAVFWHVPQSDDDTDARCALIAAGGDSQRLGLTLAEEGLFVRPVRSFDPIALARGSDVVVMASIVGRSAYNELSIALA